MVLPAEGLDLHRVAGAALRVTGTVIVSPPAAIIVWVASFSGTNCRPTGTATVTSAPVSLVKVRLSAGPMKLPLPRTSTATPATSPAMTARTSTGSTAAAGGRQPGQHRPGQGQQHQAGGRSPGGGAANRQHRLPAPGEQSHHLPDAQERQSQAEVRQADAADHPGALHHHHPAPQAATPSTVRRAKVPLPRKRTCRCRPS